MISKTNGGSGTPARRPPQADTFWATLLLIVCSTGAVAAPPRDISPLLDPIIAKHNVPGMVAAIIDSETIVAQGASGVRRRGDAQKVTLNDRFHIGSDTKMMTATLCAILVEEGKLSWNRTLL